MARSQAYVASTSLPVSVQQAFAYHERPGALERLIPPWEQATIEHSDRSLQVGSKVVLKSKVLGLPVRWVAEHVAYDPPQLFADTQLSGPFTSWDHRHEFASAGEDHSLLCDRIEYQVPLGTIGRFFGGSLARRTIEAMFAYRHRVTRHDLQLLVDFPTEPLTIAVSGSSGLVGKGFCRLLGLLGHRVQRLVRSNSDDPDDIAVWTDGSAASKLNDADAVVHLAGNPIAGKRWTTAVKQEIRDSRVIKTRQLCEQLAELEHKPRVLICASATGFYGDRGDEELTEESDSGGGFLADVAQQWEQACRPATDAGIRVVNARLGVVLTPQGGALQSMLLPAKLLGGKLGSGRQWWSWIALDDVLGALYHAIHTEALTGPVNFVSPESMTNREFARSLGSVIGRPALFPAPAPMLRLALGEMADALLLASCRVTPHRLQETSYRFRFTELEAALRYSLGRDHLESIE